MKRSALGFALLLPALSACERDAVPTALQSSTSASLQDQSTTPTAVATVQPFVGDISSFASNVLEIKEYTLASSDLNADGNLEHLLLARDLDWCGTGGCTLFIVSQSGDDLILVDQARAIKGPIRLLETSHQGWRDLGFVARFDAATHYEGRLTFDGSNYIKSELPQVVERTDNLQGALLIER